MKKILIFIFVLLCATSVSAQRGRTFEVDGYKYAVISEQERTAKLSTPGNIAVVGTNLGIVDIPDSVQCDNGTFYKVVAIGREAFCNFTIDSIHLPSSLISIEPLAFCGTIFSSHTLSLPDNIEIIGQQAFDNCRQLLSLTLPSKLRHIGSWAFANSSITEFIIPDTNQHFCLVDRMLFSKDTTILYQVPIAKSDTSAILPQPLKHIAAAALSGSPLRHVALPQSLLSIGDYAFEQSDLRTLHIPASVRSIGACPVAGCTNLGTITIDTANQSYRVAPDGFSILSADGDSLISCHLAGADYVLPPGITALGGFARCSAISVLEIPDGITTLLPGAFKETDIELKPLPQSIHTIGDGAFHSFGIHSFPSMPVLPDTLEHMGEFVFYNSAITQTKLPAGLKTLPRTAYCLTGLHDVEWNEDIEVIEPFALDVTSIQNLEITSHVRFVGDSALRTYSQYTAYFTFLHPVDSIGLHAFASYISPLKLKLVNRTPPVMTGFTIFDRDRFDNVAIRIPKGSLPAYLDDPLWGRYEGHYEEYEYWGDIFHKLTAASADTNQGIVSGSGTYTHGTTVTISALPHDGYRFSHWSDRSTQASREITLTCDTVFIAHFAPERGGDTTALITPASIPAPEVLLSGLSLTVKEVEGMPIAIHDTLGRLILRDDTSAPTRHYTLPHPGLYLLRTPHHTLKLLAR